MTGRETGPPLGGGGGVRGRLQAPSPATPTPATQSHASPRPMLSPGRPQSCRPSSRGTLGEKGETQSATSGRSNPGTQPGWHGPPRACSFCAQRRAAWPERGFWPGVPATLPQGPQGRAGSKPPGRKAGSTLQKPFPNPAHAAQGALAGTWGRTRREGRGTQEAIGPADGGRVAGAAAVGGRGGRGEGGHCREPAVHLRSVQLVALGVGVRRGQTGCGPPSPRPPPHRPYSPCARGAGGCRTPRCRPRSHCRLA